MVDCVYRQVRPPKTVMLALHGWTYTNQYWDVGYKPETYSFARHMMQAGYATFAIDRIGYGHSTHPPGTTVSLDAQAEMVHQIIKQLRVGSVGEHAFQRVALVTHSFGTPVSWLETSRYNDADAIIGTGWGASAQLNPAARFIAAIAQRPAVVDRKTSPEVGADAGYLTTPPNGRKVDYLYDLAHTDPRIVEYDQRKLRDTTPLAELATFYHRFNKASVGPLPVGPKEVTLPLSERTKDIRVPVFLLNGRKDRFFCGPNGDYCQSSRTLQHEQARYFSPKACPRAAVMPDAGHNINLQGNAPKAYRVLTKWADEALGAQGENYERYKNACGT